MWSLPGMREVFVCWCEQVPTDCVGVAGSGESRSCERNYNIILWTLDN